MAENNALPPELSSILATLAQYAPQIATPQPQPQQPPPPADPRLLNKSRTQTPHLANSFNHPQAYTQPLQDQYGQSLQQQQQLRAHQWSPASQNDQYNQQSHQYNQQSHLQHDQHNKPSNPAQVRTQPPPSHLIIDPASITVWAEGLRCVNKIATQNRDFAASIKRMISNQQKHEMQWYQGRQELKQTQARRATGATEIQNILGSLVGASSSSFSAQPPSLSSAAAPSMPSHQRSLEENEAELAAFDMKVYRAQLAMHQSMDAELKALGVPFFGTNADRILPDGEGDHHHQRTVGDGKLDEQQTDGGGGSHPKWSPRITKKELLVLQRKIIAYLEDMYKE